ncbi:hypothetical protein JKP88DRAFT_257333 [Tribonema minus]|uniref:Uncharacterized protein n=1 Tax=Tribonema minus TaxID=303371 RepID=A0A835Z9Q7_9STRA|nr:hypothetical protein JKP88DRAFT_257333 [Tribonema minus]
MNANASSPPSCTTMVPTAPCATTRSASCEGSTPALGGSVEARDPDAAVLLSALQTVYMDKLRPLEEKWYFSQFHHDAMTVADLQSKPQVLLLGQYSTGKAVMAGSEDRIIKGTALCLIDELPFTGLSRFGAAFLNHFEASICDAEILEHITFVDTPGVLVSGKQGDQRGYSFAHAVKWFADRSDMILLVFDVHKLDISEEFRQLIGALGAHAEKLRIVLNKAQEVDADRLIKVFGALMWGVGRAFKHKSEVPKVYVGSFWDGPKRHPDRRVLFQNETFAEDEALLRREMMQLPRNVGLRKINEMTKRAKLAKVHACILDHLRSQMPWYGAEAAQQRLMEQLPEVFTAVKRKYGFPDGDMPDIERYSVYHAKLN